ncbi:PREDICTED: uncharacterized protein LOC109485270 isoform X2 [Branchiostoma belcheri]|uniref:Kringle-containing protein marking the eye and the nose n=1 Tax=Branchiostoma belcheri TaxID=7741 RepID=A0A6P5AQL6_BRABE|nr:PREDICTED: uncharacterized protein LOC109485270 isoform X2 [Branchiostoma belcheri]
MGEKLFLLGLVALVCVRVRSQLEECYTRVDDRVVYEGRVNVSESGDPCLQWSATGGQKPLHNYCRAPRVGDLKPWCYVLVGGKSLVEAQCDIQHCTECYTLTGSDYRGNQSEPYSGVGTACMSWADTGGGKQVSTARYPGGSQGIGEHNYCRNPDGRSTLWCYTGQSPGSALGCRIQNCKAPGYLGCYKAVNPYNVWRITRQQPFATLTIPYCLDFCRRQGAQYGGVNRGTHCYCITGPRTSQRILREVNDCSTPCSGDNRQFCGGQSSMALFDVKMGRCGGNLYSTRGTVYSPNWPNPFPTSKICSWTITVPEDRFVRLQFKYYDIPDKNDYVSVWNNDTDSGLVLKPQDMKDGYVVESNVVNLYFSSDPHGSGGGFSLLYEAIKQCPKPNIRDGMTSASFFLPGHKASFRCRWGFTRVGPRTATCQDNGEFDQLPECVPNKVTTIGPKRTAAVTETGGTNWRTKTTERPARPIGPTDSYRRPFSTKDSHDTTDGLPTPVAEADPGTSDKRSSRVKFSYVLILIVALSIAVLLIVVLLVFVIILCKQKKDRERHRGNERRNGEVVVYETVPMTATKSSDDTTASNGHTTFHPPKQENIYDSVPEVQYATVNKQRKTEHGGDADDKPENQKHDLNKNEDRDTGRDSGGDDTHDYAEPPDVGRPETADSGEDRQ